MVWFGGLVAMFAFWALLLGASADVVTRGSSPIAGVDAKGCGYDQVRLRTLCIFCTSTTCGIYSMSYRGAPFAERTDILSGSVTVRSFTVQSSRRLAYVYYSNNSLIQYNMDSLSAAPLDTGFSFSPVASSVCGSVTLDAPLLMTVSPDGKAYGVLSTSGACANTMHIVEYIVPPPGSTIGGSQSTIVVTLASETSPGTVVSITTAESLASSSAVFFVALSNGSTCSTISYIRIVPRASSPSASQISCGSSTCALSSPSVGSSVMLAYRDMQNELIVTQRNCHVVVALSSNGVSRIFAGIGQSGYKDGYSTSEAKIESPSSPAIVNNHRVFLVSADTVNSNLVGRLSGATNTASTSKTVTLRSSTLEHSSTTSFSFTTTDTVGVSASMSESSTRSWTASCSRSLSDSVPTVTSELSLTPTSSSTWSPTVSRESSMSPTYTTSQSQTRSSSPTGAASTSRSLSTSITTTASQSPRASRSSSMSLSQTAGVSASPSVTLTFNVSLSGSESQSHNSSQTVLRRTLSDSSSGLVSASLSPNATPSLSNRRSASASIQRVSPTLTMTSASTSGSISLWVSVTRQTAASSQSASSLSTSKSMVLVASRTAAASLSASQLSGAHLRTFSLSVAATWTSTTSLQKTRSDTVSLTSTVTILATRSRTSTPALTPSSSPSLPLFVPKEGHASAYPIIIGAVVGSVVGLGAAVAVFYTVFHTTAVAEGAAAGVEAAPPNIVDGPAPTATSAHAPYAKDDGEAIQPSHREVDVAQWEPTSTPGLPFSSAFDAAPWWATTGAPPPPTAHVASPLPSVSARGKEGSAARVDMTPLSRRPHWQDPTTVGDSDDDDLWFEPDDS